MLPNSFDVRTAWPQRASVLVHIRDQSVCGIRQHRSLATPRQSCAAGLGQVDKNPLTEKVEFGAGDEEQDVQTRGMRQRHRSKHQAVQEEKEEEEEETGERRLRERGAESEEMGERRRNEMRGERT